MPRSSNQVDRRRQLLEAAGRRAVRDGITGLRVEDVAEEAGLSPHTVRYYYSDIDRLLVEVHRSAVERFYEARRRYVEEEPDPRGRLARCLTAGLPAGPYDGSWRLLGLSSQVARSDDLYPILMSNLYHRQVGLYRAILEAGCASGAWDLRSDAETVARTLVALEDKLGLLVMWGDPATDAATARRLLLAYAELVTGTGLQAHLPAPGT